MDAQQNDAAGAAQNGIAQAPGVQSGTQGLTEDGLRQRITQLERQVEDLSGLAQLGLLTGGVAHEINNLLTGAMGFTYLLGRQFAGGESSERKMLNAVSSELTRCATLTKSLVQHSRTIPISRQPVELIGLLRSTLEEAGPLMISRQIVPRWEVQDNAVWIQGLPSQLETMFSGLFLNAADRSSPDCDGRSMRVRVTRTDKETVVSLQDSTGPGDPPTVLEPLYQATPGLAPFAFIIAKAVMKEHNGRMELNRNQEGLLCSLRFPRLER